ncbi:MAG TPA: MBL fold metallo-hydrolase [Gemmatimonadales bacterium]|nr:MBL fold metallo-hydrolase [Gemmatimonadales bacterium]
MRLRFLGTGTSFGIPQVGCDCQVCHSADARDQRSRSAALVEQDDIAVLIDTPPELRLQLIRAQVRKLDAVLYTHEHADHIAGIDDLRAFSVQSGQPLPVYGPPETVSRLARAYEYIFDDDVQPVAGTSKPRLQARALEAGRTTVIAGLPVVPLELFHGAMRVFGYRIGPLAYITDVKSVPPAVYPALQDVQVLVLNALWWRPHPTHLSIPEAIAVAQQVGAPRTFLTHLTHETGHAALAAALPPGIAPAYDGLVVEVS